MTNAIIKYVTDSGNVELSPEIIKSYLVPSDSKITDQEIGLFLQLCKFQKLNPFLKEVYIVKYGTYPATFITGKETFLKRAKKDKSYRGHTVGISEDGKTAWAEVHIEDFEVPIRCEVEFNEYVPFKDGKPNKMWTAKPKTMLKKVALVQALREAFPQDLEGLYSQEEINSGESLVDINAVDVTKAETKSGTSKEKAASSSTTNANQSNDGQASEEKDGDTGEAFIKVVKVTKKKVDDTKSQYFIFSAGETMYSTFDSGIAEEADKIKGSDHEALVLFKVAIRGDKTYYNIQEKGFNIQP